MAGPKRTRPAPAEQALPGKRFGILTFLRAETPGPRFRKAVCRCNCGRVVVVRRVSLWDGTVIGCGCGLTKKFLAAKIRLKHLRRDHPVEYRTWLGIIARCYSPNGRAFGYGSRGIEVCRRWRRSFPAFFRDMGPRPSPKHSIDRIDYRGNYEPGNCRWADVYQQQRNRSCARMIEYGGRRLCLAAWAELTGIPAHTIGGRLDNLGWDVARALTTPVRGRGGLQPVNAQP